MVHDGALPATRTMVAPPTAMTGPMVTLPVTTAMVPTRSTMMPIGPTAASRTTRAMAAPLRPSSGTNSHNEANNKTNNPTNDSCDGEPVW